MFRTFSYHRVAMYPPASMQSIKAEWSDSTTAGPTWKDDTAYKEWSVHGQILSKVVGLVASIVAEYQLSSLGQLLPWVMSAVFTMSATSPISPERLRHRSEPTLTATTGNALAMGACQATSAYISAAS